MKDDGPGNKSNNDQKNDQQETNTSPQRRKASRRPKTGRGFALKNPISFFRDAYDFYSNGTGRIQRIVIAGFDGHDPQHDILIRNDDVRYAGVKTAQEEWSVSFPSVCVVCGKDTDNPQVDETRKVIDYTWPIRLLIGSVFVALIPGFCLLGWWAPPVIVLAGAGLGYFLASRRKVHLKVCRCKSHSRRRKQPQLHYYANELVIRVKEPRVKQEFVKQNRRRDEENAAPKKPRRSFVPQWLANHGAKFAAIIWIGTGVIQLLAAIVESIAVFFLVSLLLSAAAGAAWWQIGVILILGLAYVLFRLRIGWTFFRAGIDTLSREAKGIVANALGSIGLGVMFALPLWPIYTGKWQNLPHSDPANAVSLTTFPGLWVPIGFALNALLLIAAGLLALAGRRGFHQIEAEDQTFMFRTSCPACSWPVDVLGQTKINTLHTCVECGKSFRLEPEETQGKQ